MKSIYSLLLCTVAILLASCSSNRTLSKNIQKLNNDSLFNSAHIGFILQDDAGKTLVAHNASKLFIPASNTKLFTTYAVLRTWPDSLPGWFVHHGTDTLYLKPNGDPTFLHPAFSKQQVFQQILNSKKVVVIEKTSTASFTRLGFGWSWNSYQEWYMPERSGMPIYGNVVKFEQISGGVKVTPSYFQNKLKVNNIPQDKKMSVSRAMDSNDFTANPAAVGASIRPFTQKEDADLNYRLLADTLAKLHKQIHFAESQIRNEGFWKPYYTYKTSEVLTPMMHQSDNFMAEQLLLMAGSKLVGKLADRQAIAALQQSDFSSFPQSFVWVDGSGLSRNNNFSPQVLTALLYKMRQSFGWETVRQILQKDQATATDYYKGYENNIWSKTGTLGGNSTTLSGYLLTKKGKRYFFSFLVNNHHQNQVSIRRAVEKYLVNIIENY
ncbi:D-alanyl-D-alanine carboxypeptidase/D-alanyl-D-alanine-endopeptidase [Pedobacter nanyangensis]|uniref:D-alanyl-D-alanine carboxypeptidase/D-alanyl-D-alanine-endopeptidase n=1 Tax=Pedobacter nanyangensis TaxID=1562389 RepID=UPI0013B36486|nr:D-alanyl-D-alanine carboxypeptidase [Pedobacter nanyangensis]